MEDKTLKNDIITGASTTNLGSSTLAGMASEATGVKNVVLVHGAFADGSGYKALYKVLSQNGYQVTVVQNPLTSLEDDVAATRVVLDKQDGPTILAGHSWGGAVITQAGNHPNVAGLVYVAAFSPDEGESLGKLLSPYPPDPKNGILPPANGFSWYDKAKFHEGFCADLSKEQADLMADSQVPVAASAFTYVFKEIAWKSKPTWHIVATEDHSLPPDLERFMGKRTGGKVSEIKGSHAFFMSHPKEVADIIEGAAKETASK
jgi:pimeloyl-ACP methyl ester carboxylesterase